MRNQVFGILGAVWLNLWRACHEGRWRNLSWFWHSLGPWVHVRMPRHRSVDILQRLFHPLVTSLHLSVALRHLNSRLIDSILTGFLLAPSRLLKEGCTISIYLTHERRFLNRHWAIKMWKQTADFEKHVSSKPLVDPWHDVAWLVDAWNCECRVHHWAAHRSVQRYLIIVSHHAVFLLHIRELHGLVYAES